MAEETARAAAIGGRCPSKMRLAISWTAYILGWVVWFVSLWMPAQDEGFLGQWPTVMVLIYYFANIGEVLNGTGSGEARRFATMMALRFLPYIPPTAKI